MIILYVIVAVIVLFLAVLLIRAAMYKPYNELKPSGEKVILNEEKIVSDMVEMIRCKTVSYNDEKLINKEEFRKFQELLPKLAVSAGARRVRGCKRDAVSLEGKNFRGTSCADVSLRCGSCGGESLGETCL